MDGTLLDEHSEIPQGFWPMLARLRSRGVEFVPASGRQYATLRAMFADKAAQVLDGGELSYIAENGNVVAIDGNIAEVHRGWRIRYGIGALWPAHGIRAAHGQAVP